ANVAFKKMSLAWALGLTVAGCNGSYSEPMGPSHPAPSSPSAPGHPDDGFFPDGGLTPQLAPPARLGAVVTPERRPPPISGGTLTVTPDGALAVAADPDRDQVHLVTLSDKSVTSLAFPAGSEPGRAVLDASGRAHV